MERARELVFTGPLEASVVDVALPAARPGDLAIEVLLSGVSAGTELSIYRGTNPRLRLAAEVEAGSFACLPPLRYPVRGPGYMQVGRVVEALGDPGRTGELVALRCGHRSAVVCDAGDEVTSLPESIPMQCGVWVQHMLPICANGLLYAAAEATGGRPDGLGEGVTGRDVVVIGSGVIGLLLAMWATWLGACDVVVADTSEARLTVAQELGFTALQEAHVAAHLRATRSNPGADVVFQCRGVTTSLAVALRCLRAGGSVIDLAFYQDDGRNLRLGEDFHHAGLTIRAAQIGNRPRGLLAAWPKARLVAEGLDFLAACHEPLARVLLSDPEPFESAPEVFAALTANRGERTRQTVFRMSA